MTDTTTPVRSAAAEGTDGSGGRRTKDGKGRRGKGEGSQLFRNAYALMLNTGISAVLGLGYWAVAARYYSDDAVGQGSAAIAAMKFLAGLTAVTLIGALARFIPVAGRTTRGLILRIYGASSAIVAFAGLLFLGTLDWWGPSYRFLHGWLTGLGFIAAVVAWSLLTLQDGVLTGLRSAKWVPVGNTVFSTAKLVLLVALAAVIPTTGVFVSWAVAILLSTVPLGWLVFRRLVPQHVRATEDTAQPAGYREMGRFLAGDYTGALFSLAVVYLIPVIVASQVSSADNAYFYITTTIGGTINLLAINMGASLTVESSHHPARLAANCRAAMRRMVTIMLPLCTLLFLFAPQILGMFGQGYADAATPLLRWYAVGAVLRVVIEVYYGVLRAQSRTSGLAYLQGLLFVLVLGLTVALLPRMGLTGAGVAETSSLSLVAAIAGWKLYKVLRHAPKVPLGATPAPDGDLADLAADGDDGGYGRDATEQTGAGAGRPSWAAHTPYESEEPTLQLRADVEHLERHPSVTPPRGTLPPEPPLRASAALQGLLERLRRPGTLLWMLLGAALAMYLLPLRGMGEAELEQMGGLGLVTVLPTATLMGAALLVCAFAAGLWVSGQHRAFLAVALIVTVVALHAVPALMEGQPRFPTAWQHLGFLDFIERTGATAPDMDARWSWPGFFAGAAFLAQACGVDDLTGLIRWWPTVIQLAYLAPLAVLLKAVKAHWRAKWCALWFFALCGWVGQDYFSPQGFTFLFYLLFIALLLVWFRQPRPLRRGKFQPGETDEVPGPERRAERAVLILVLISLFIAAVAGHQLTPFVMTGVLIGLALVRRTSLYGMPLLCGVLVTVWVGFLAEPYWAGHFDELFGGIGGVGGNVSSSVSGRIEGGSEIHQLVLYTRVALAAGTLAFAGIGLLRRRSAGYSDRALLVLTGLPFLAFGAQSYGGEIALRVFLFAAPAACVLAALAFWPRPSGHREGSRWRRHLPPLAALLAGLVLMGGFLVARWGNESFERVRAGEVEAMHYVYAHDKPTVRLLWMTNDPVEDVTPAMPWGEKDVERVEYQPVLAPLKPAKAAPVVEALREAGPNSYLMLNESQSTYLHQDSGYPADWQQRITAALDKRKDVRKVLTNEDATVYTLREQPAGKPDPPDPGPIGPQITWTPWSVMGGLAAVALILLLGAREVVRVAVRPSERKVAWLQSTFWFSLPLLLLFLGVLIQRFWTMS